jgi:hypothetical protein
MIWNINYFWILIGVYHSVENDKIYLKLYKA